MEENAKVSTHQLIIHDAFKACAAAQARRHGNCRVSCHTVVVHQHFGLWLRLARRERERQASRLQWREKTTMGQKVISFCWEYGGFVICERNIYVCVYACVHVHKRACIKSRLEASAVHMCCINITVLILQSHFLLSVSAGFFFFFRKAQSKCFGVHCVYI